MLKVRNPDCAKSSFYIIPIEWFNGYVPTVALLRNTYYIQLQLDNK